MCFIKLELFFKVGQRFGEFLLIETKQERQVHMCIGNARFVAGLLHQLALLLEKLQGSGVFSFVLIRAAQQR